MLHAERLARAVARLLGGGFAVDQGGDLVGEDLLGVVQRFAALGDQAVDFAHRQEGEETKKLAHVAVGGVAPELVELVGRRALGREPDVALLGFAELAAVGLGHEGEGQAGERGVLEPAAELDAHDDVAPLVLATELQRAAFGAPQVQEVVGLHDHVVEFKEGDAAALHAALHRVHGQHAVDAEVRADLAQQVDPAERGQPVGVVEQLGAGG